VNSKKKILINNRLGERITALEHNHNIRIEKLENRIDGNQAILTVNRQDIKKLENSLEIQRNLNVGNTTSFQKTWTEIAELKKTIGCDAIGKYSLYDLYLELKEKQRRSKKKTRN